MNKLETHNTCIDLSPAWYVKEYISLSVWSLEMLTATCTAALLFCHMDFFLLGA